MKSKFLTALLSLAIAFGLWLYVVTVVSPESEANYYGVPVVFDGASQLNDRNLMITSGTDITLDLRLSGNRTDLNKLDKTNITILADLSQITKPGEHNLNVNISYPSSAGAIEVLNQEPAFITIQVSERARKEVPVRITYSGSVPDNFTADVQNAVLDHTTVTLSGPKEVVDQIEYAAISVDLTDRMDTIVETHRHTLCGADGQPVEDVSSVTVNVSDIRLTVPVYQIKEVPLVLKVEAGGGITPEMVKITPDRTTITVSGSREVLQNLNEIVLGIINLGQLDEDTEQLVFEIKLPENVKNVTGVTQVNVKVKMPEMEIGLYALNNFLVINVPDGYYVRVKTESVVVKLRGPADLLNQISVADIRAVVDCSNQTLIYNSLNTLILTVTVPNVEGVGVLNDYYTVTAYVAVLSSHG